MRRWVYLLILFIGGPLIQACNSNDHHIAREYDKKRRLIKKYIVNKRDQKDGEYREYYTDGTLKLLFNYSNDSLKGEQESFYANGVLQSKGYYLNNHLDSILYFYYANKNLKSESFRLKGKSFGVQKEYENNGKLKSLFFMMNDSDMASSLDIDDDGRIINKKGDLITCIYEKKIISTKDTLKALFYTVLPPGYTYEYQLLDRKNNEVYKINTYALENINNNKAVLVTKNYKEPGNYQIKMILTLTNQRLHSSIVDSLILPFTVK